MKPILVDMKDMSDSKEVYESRPHPFFILFIYLILLLFLIALIWAACFQIDIVVTGTGTIEAQENSSTVTNMKAGNIVKCYVSDGQQVKAGELLYEIEHDDLKLELANSESQNTENKQKLLMLEAYQQWLSDDTTNLTIYEKNTFYPEYFARSRIVQLKMEAASQEYQNEHYSYDTKLGAGENLVVYYNNEISKLNQLSSAVKSRTNPFSSDEAYYYAKANDYLTQYQNTQAQYETTIEVLQKNLGDAFDGIAAANETIDKAQTEEQKATATAQCQAYEATAKEKQQALDTAKVQQLTALTNLETETIAGIESSILTYQQNIVTNEGSQEEIKTAMSNMEKTGIESTTENIRQTELQTVTVEISTCKTKQKELEVAMSELQKNIEDAKVCAPIGGIINLSSELVQDNFLAAGESVLTIIPQDENGYIVKSYIDNQDIAKVSEGLEVKYEIAAYPSSEYGTLTGKVDFVSADLKTGSETGSAYYMVETTVDNTGLYNRKGEQMVLKVGMLCETKIIVEQKSVLRYLLEKIRLTD